MNQPLIAIPLPLQLITNEHEPNRMGKYVDLVNKEKKEAVMRLYGEIGKEVDANRFAQSLAALDSQVDTVHMHINSPGGDVLSGLSIISAMRSMQAFVHVHVEGIAASMAAVIAVCGDRVSMQDYSKLMIHDPFFSGVDKAKMNDKAAKALGSITDTLQTILSRRGCKKEKIASLMAAETWFTADEAKTEGLIDDVVSSQRKAELENLTHTELLSRIANEYKPVNNNEMDLTKIAAGLGLPATATEQQVLDAIQAAQTGGAAERASLVDHYLSIGVKNGTVTEKNKERMKKLAAADFGLFADTILDGEGDLDGAEGTSVGQGDVGVKPAQANGRLSAAIGELRGKGAGAQAQDAKDWNWYQRHSPRALAEMETKEPQKFKRLLDEYENNL